MVVILAACDVFLLYAYRQNKIRTNILQAENESLIKEMSRIGYLYEFEHLLKASKNKTVFRLQNELHPLNNCKVYTGSDSTQLKSLDFLAKEPKLIFGSSQNMCSPCIYAVLDELKKEFPDFEKNEHILFVADVEQRLKNNYYGKKTLSFRHRRDSDVPYLFVLENDMMIKLLFLADKTSPELTQAYLSAVKKRYPKIAQQHVK